MSGGWTHLYPSTQQAEAGGFSEFKANLVYKVSSRAATVVTQRNHVLGKKEKRKEVKREEGRKGGRCHNPECIAVAWKILLGLQACATMPRTFVSSGF